MLLVLAAALVIVFAIEYTAKRIFPLKFQGFVIEYSRQHNIDPFLVYAIIKAESNFRPDAVSKKDARGLMQISKITGEWGAAELKLENYTQESLFTPEINIKIGCWYLRKLMDEFNNNTDLVIAAYNGGSGNVSQWLKNEEYSMTGQSLNRIPFRETETFLKRVKIYYSIYKFLYG
ncbi:MAG TPA: lytic transglycosylase domain-containing protein [Clostridiaceae bacterium]|nr:lytic transglycosylase domain-containing protein [Clostridiaceae bacterium]